MRTNGPEKREESKDPEGTLTAPMGQRVKTWRRGILVGLEGRNPQGFTVRLGRGWSKMPRDLEQVMLCVHSSTKHLFTVPGQCGTVEPIWFTPHLCDGCAS